MTTIGSMLAQEERQKLIAVAATERAMHTQVIAEVSDNTPTKIAVHDASGKTMQVNCCQCQGEFSVLKKAPRLSRKFMCADCAPEYLMHNNPLMVRINDPKRPRTITTTKETPVSFDLNKLSDAELGQLAVALGAILKERMHARAEDVIKPAREEAVKAKKKDGKKKDKEHKAARKAMATAPVLPEIVVSSSLTVPALDLSDVTSLDETISPAVRSPYNKAVYRLKLRESLDKDTTYREVAVIHQQVADKVAEKPAAKPKKAEVKTEVVAEVTEQTLITDDMVAAVASVKGVSKKKARKILEAL